MLTVRYLQSIRCLPRLQVPFMRNWFKDQCTTAFTVMFWFKRDPGNFGKVGLVHNGDCIDAPTFLVYGDESPSHDKQVVGGVDTIGTGLTFTNPALVCRDGYIRE